MYDKIKPSIPYISIGALGAASIYYDPKNYVAHLGSTAALLPAHWFYSENNKTRPFLQTLISYGSVALIPQLILNAKSFGESITGTPRFIKAITDYIPIGELYNYFKTPAIEFLENQALSAYTIILDANSGLASSILFLGTIGAYVNYNFLNSLGEKDKSNQFQVSNTILKTSALIYMVSMASYATGSIFAPICTLTLTSGFQLYKLHQGISSRNDQSTLCAKLIAGLSISAISILVDPPLLSDTYINWGMAAGGGTLLIGLASVVAGYIYNTCSDIRKKKADAPLKFGALFGYDKIEGLKEFTADLATATGQTYNKVKLATSNLFCGFSVEVKECKILTAKQIAYITAAANIVNSLDTTNRLTDPAEKSAQIYRLANIMLKNESADFELSNAAFNELYPEVIKCGSANTQSQVLNFLNSADIANKLGAEKNIVTSMMVSLNKFIGPDITR